MPHINRIRVNNVKYNFGTQFYDDFVMRFSGQNAIYDLANGGGKSVLMLLLLQNLIPNCTLDEKQPIDKLFRTGNDNAVIHSLIEWKLNSCDVKNGFQYMTTGFCARKARDNGAEEASGETAAVEYFNYCIFYREFQENDIVNLPLSDGKERITYTGLRNYLRDLSKKNFNVQVHMFDRKGDYQRFISDYGLYESEWEIIRGINKTEGHVRTYFETHYRTTRKVVEDLFIEEIIEKSFRGRMEHGEGETEIAKTLLDIKDKLVELSKKKGEMSHYDSQLEALESFQVRLSGLKGIYGKKAGLEEELVKTYHTAKRQMQSWSGQLKETKELAQGLGEQKLSLSKGLENAKIMEAEQVRRGLLESLGQVKREYDKLEGSCKLLEGSLKERESANDYFDYIENKKQIEVQHNVLSNMSGNEEELLEELHTLAYNRKLVKEETLRDLEEKREVTRQQLEQNQEQIQRFDKEERHAQNEVAVCKSREAALVRQAASLERRLRELREKCGLLLLEEAKERLDKSRIEGKRLYKECTEIEGQLHETSEEYQKLLWDTEQFQNRLHTAEKEHERAKAAVDEREESHAKFARMKEIYGEQTADALLSRILEAYRSHGARRAQAVSHIEEVRELLGSEDDSMPVVISEVHKQVLAYVKRHYDEQARLGCDYLAACSLERRGELLGRIPYLPYAILVHEDIFDISIDKKLMQMEFGGHIIPFILVEQLEKEPQKLACSDVCFVMPDNEVIYNKLRLDETIRKLREHLAEEERALKRMEEQGSVLEEDMAFLLRYMEWERQAKGSREAYQAAIDNLHKLHESDRTNRERKQQLAGQLENLTKLQQEKEQEREKLAEYQEHLAQISQVYEEYLQADKELSKCRSDKGKALKEAEARHRHVEELASACAAQEEMLRGIEEARRQEEENWRSYAPYDEKGTFPVIEMDLEELESLFEGKKLAFEQGNADVSDKKQLIATYEKAMEKSLAAIRYQGMSIDILKVLYEEHKLSKTPMEQLMQEKSVLEREQQELANVARELADCQTRLDREEGGLRHAKDSYEEKFGEYEPLQMEPERLPLFMKEAKEQLQGLKNESKELERRQKDLEKQCYGCTSMIEEMERMIEGFAIPADAYKGILPAGVSLQDTYKRLRKDYERMFKEEQSRREDFEKDKAKLVETLRLLGAYDLSEEIGRSLSNPRNILEIEAYLDNIGRTMECIRLEKERIGKGIENMEVIKDNFENRCLQTCSTIRESLERLPNLSAIRLDDRQVHMIMLQIPYVKEEFYKERMSKYIDEVVEQADTFATAAERLKYIRSKLAWKRLFSVIVKDMDKVRLQLYKRERMKEQSRYLKYEEAVGSTGQSQGIYIQFLVAVINYIASMNARNADSALLRKVIFLDNPFGAAKDVYIWEPIFKLLEANHVQLIVPARGATPAITGRFAVNYILGQKLVGGRQQTVVVDYRSEVNTTALEYIELEFEQGMLELE